MLHLTAEFAYIKSEESINWTFEEKSVFKLFFPSLLVTVLENIRGVWLYLIFQAICECYINKSFYVSKQVFLQHSDHKVLSLELQ